MTPNEDAMILLPRIYGAYGESTASGRARSSYAGDVAEAGTGWYLLGGRPYSPVLRRFLAPDTASPFDEGGLNRYAYCSGDPINRIDPNGDSWLDILTMAVAVTFAVVGVVASGGALVGPLSGGAAAAASTPGIVATGIAATADVVVLAATIGSAATMTEKDQKLNGILGWIATVAGVISGAGLTMAARQAANAGKEIASGVPKLQGVRRLSEADVTPPPGGAARANARPQIVSSADVGAPSAPRPTTGRFAKNPARNTVVVAPDANLSQPQLTQLANSLSSEGTRRTTLYTGVPDARSASQPSPARNGAARALHRRNLERTARKERSAGVEINVANTDNMSPEQVRNNLAEDGIPASTNTFGMVDSLMLNVLNIPKVISSLLLPVRASF